MEEGGGSVGMGWIINWPTGRVMAIGYAFMEGIILI